MKKRSAKAAAARVSSLIPKGVPKNIRVYDNGGKTADRYIIVFSGAMAKGTQRSRDDFYSGNWGKNAAKKDILADEGGASRFFYCAKERRYKRVVIRRRSRAMAWLCRLVCPPGGTVLDPFAGSGTTLVAAKELGLGYIGIEQDMKYLKMAVKRLAATSDPTKARSTA